MKIVFSKAKSMKEKKASLQGELDSTFSVLEWPVH